MLFTCNTSLQSRIPICVVGKLAVRLTSQSSVINALCPPDLPMNTKHELHPDWPAESYFQPIAIESQCVDRQNRPRTGSFKRGRVFRFC